MNDNLKMSAAEWIAVIVAAVALFACGWVILGLFGALMGSVDDCTLSVMRGIAMIAGWLK
ncbi:MAG: hypothetical protein ACI4R9_00225 [Kiritimatiellia bacterium]